MSQVELGKVEAGSCHRVRLQVTNEGPRKSRFRVVDATQEPCVLCSERSESMFVGTRYQPGAIAPGMSKAVELEIYTGMDSRDSQMYSQCNTIIGEITGPFKNCVRLRSPNGECHVTITGDLDAASAAVAAGVAGNGPEA